MGGSTAGGDRQPWAREVPPPEGLYSTEQGVPGSGGSFGGAELTITGHANQQALLEAALLAAVAVDADDGAVLVLEALLVLDVLLDAAAEEALWGTEGVTQGPSQHRRGSPSLQSHPGTLQPSQAWTP